VLGKPAAALLTNSLDLKAAKLAQTWEAAAIDIGTMLPPLLCVARQ
jgi:hypothetical protein